MGKYLQTRHVLDVPLSNVLIMQRLRIHMPSRTSANLCSCLCSVLASACCAMKLLSQKGKPTQILGAPGNLGDFISDPAKVGFKSIHMT